MKPIVPKLYLIVPLTKTGDPDFEQQDRMICMASYMTALAQFEEELTERRPAALIEVNPQSAKVLKKHNRNKNTEGFLI